jgi:hypothetical protein
MTMSAGKDDELYEDLTMDHEKLAGQVMLDPWDDDEQTDWPNNREEDSSGNDDLGTDGKPGPAD